MAVTGIKEMARNISKLLDAEVDKIYFRIRYHIINITKNRIKISLKEHPTYAKIAAGQYNAHFGFYPGTGESRVFAIVNRLIDTLDVTFVKTGNLITLEAFIDYGELYILNEAKVINDSKNPNRENPLDWLEWLLESGGTVVVNQYHIVYGNFNSKNSRSLEAVMDKTGTWSVPLDIAGTISSNWITQSFAVAEQKLSPIIKQQIIYEMKTL